MAYKLIKAAQSQVEGRQPAASGGVRPRERTVPQGQAPRTARRHHPGTVTRHAGVPGRLTIPGPQDLTISRGSPMAHLRGPGIEVWLEPQLPRDRFLWIEQ
jgi:hypothetical protein